MQPSWRRELARRMGQCSWSIKLQLLICFMVFVIDQTDGDASLTGQYLGTRSLGNEHMLLFKLPDDMISATDDRNSARSDSHSPIFGHNMQAERDLILGSEAVEQPVSLNIPLASLSQTDPSDGQSEFVYEQPATQQQHVSEGRIQPMIQYIASNQQITQPSQQNLPYNMLMTASSDPEVGATYVRVPFSRPSELEQASSRSNANYTESNVSSLEQQIRQLMLQRHLIQQQLHQTEVTTMKTTTQAYEQPTEAPQLWRDTLSAQGQRQTGLGSQQIHVDSASLLNRLAASSPELLMRLRSMLRRASSVQSKSPMNGTLTDQLTQTPSYADLGDLSSSMQTPADKAMLQSFLQSQNITSHEEIKIPLVVIAMPRILSLKRDQMLANTQRQPSANVSQYQYGSSQPFVNFTRDSLSNITSGTGWMKSLVDAATASNASSYLSRNQQSIQQQIETPVEQPTPTTTSSPQHTMAPYARQFGSPSVSIARYFVKPTNTMRLTSGAQVKLAPTPISIAKNQYVETTLDPIGSRFAYPPSQVARSVVESVTRASRLAAADESLTTEQHAPDTDQARHLLIRMNREQHEPEVGQMRLLQLRRASSTVQPHQRVPAAYEYRVQANEGVKVDRDRLAVTSDRAKFIETRVVPADDSLGRLRPLFQTGSSSSQNNPQDRFSNEQMLSLLARSGRIERLPSSDAHSQTSSATGPIVKKKNPKMVFMIV